MEYRRYKKIFLLHWITISLTFGLCALYGMTDLLQTIIYSAVLAIIITQSYAPAEEPEEIKNAIEQKNLKSSPRIEYLLYFLGCWTLLSLLLSVLIHSQIYLYELFISALLSSLLFAGCYLFCRS
jgi:cell division protein FtsL